MQMACYAGAKQQKVGNALEAVSSNTNGNEKSDSDTTVTATFAGEVRDFNPDMKGGLMELVRTDSTVTIPKSEVNNFNNYAPKSIQNQVE